MVTPSVIEIGLKSSGEAGGRGKSITLAGLSGNSGRSGLFFRTNLEGAEGRDIAGREIAGLLGMLLRIRSLISGVTTFSVLVRIKIFVVALGMIIFFAAPGCEEASFGRIS